MNVEESWKIGEVEIPGKLILAPMAGVTDLPYRRICKEMGADLICTEMVSAKGIYYNSPNTQPLLQINPKERPVSLQLFGADPDIISEMAARIEELPFDILDINMGCPVPKVVNNGEGSALLKNVPLAEEIIRKTVRAIHKPVTVKFRKGFRDGENPSPRTTRYRPAKDPRYRADCSQPHPFCGVAQQWFECPRGRRAGGRIADDCQALREMVQGAEQVKDTSFVLFHN